jgi:hypothetical protein
MKFINHQSQKLARRIFTYDINKLSSCPTSLIARGVLLAR